MVKIERSMPAPASLKAQSRKLSGSYSEPDVIERLKRDFHNKCYICEINNLQDPEAFISFHLQDNDIAVTGQK